MGKLREVYPNVLHLEKPGIMATNENHELQREKLKASEIDMFRDFFNQVSGRDLTDDQDTALQEVISELHKTEGTI